MANTTLENFIEASVQDICSYLQVKGIEGNIHVTDPAVKTAVKLTYSLIKSYCKRDFMYKEELEEYYPIFRITGESLRLAPVESIIKVVSNGVELAATDYTLKGNTLSLGADYNFLTGGSYLDEDLTSEVTVTYTGGLKTAGDVDILGSALIIQAISFYHNRSILGLDSVSSDKGTSKKSPIENGHLSQSVMELLGDLIYYGCAEIL